MPLSYDLVCPSHLRWDFVYQRPQHLLSRFARERRVFYVEEPVFDADTPCLHSTIRECGAWVIVPHLPDGLTAAEIDETLCDLMDQLFSEQGIEAHVLWYYTAMAIPWTRHLTPLATVYDCMDELSAFQGAPPILRQHERELFARADLVFTGGQSLYEAKRPHHSSVHLFPSSVDVPHFAKARQPLPDPSDQAGIPGPRIGFYGVIDERMDLDLLAGLAEARPEWQIVMVGPIAKIDPLRVPRHDNIHYLGPKHYADLPEYLAGWDVAMLPFARNESTRFISPTKTPEYLAAGKPVVSTPITDVVRPYGEQELVWIADTPSAFVDAIEQALRDDGGHLQGRADAFLAQMSWDRTWSEMAAQIDVVIDQRSRCDVTRAITQVEWVPEYVPAATD